MGRVMGTRLKDLIVKRGTEKKIGFYEIIAERIAIPASEEAAIHRGRRLEDEAIDRYVEMTGKKLNRDLVIWSRDDNDSIAISPDAFEEGKKITEAVECKCLSSARHLQAYLTKTIPDEYEAQKLQYFIVNDDLQKLTFCFYDPRMPIDFFTIEVVRADVQAQVNEYLELEKSVLQEIDAIEQQLTF